MTVRRDHLTAEVAVNRHAFHPKDGSARRGVAKGAFVTDGPSLDELWAPVDIPFGAIVTGIRARVVDNTGGASIGVQLYEVGNTGGANPVSSEATSLGFSNSTSAQSTTGTALFTHDDIDTSFEVRVRVNQGNIWSNSLIADEIQVVGVFIDYEMEVEPVS